VEDSFCCANKERKARVLATRNKIFFISRDGIAKQRYLAGFTPGQSFC
jgi:hypothetical protein